MSKLAELKATIKAKLDPILGKIFKNRGKAAPAEATKEPNFFGRLSKTYREGSTATRLTIFILFLIFTVGVFSLSKLTLLLVKRKDMLTGFMHKGTVKYDKMEEFLKHQAETKHDIASTVGLDRVRINSMSETGKRGFLSITLWVKCSDPRTAKFVEDNYPKLHDAIVTRIQEVQEKEVTTESGKKKLQAAMKDAMNSVLRSGKVEEVFFYNMIFE